MEVPIFWSPKIKTVFPNLPRSGLYNVLANGIRVGVFEDFSFKAYFAFLPSPPLPAACHLNMGVVAVILDYRDSAHC